MPTEKIFLVQLADYFFEYSDKQADMIELARHQRLFPGEGLHDVRDLVRLLEDKGYQGHYTFEVFNDDYVNSDPMVVGERGMKSAQLGERQRWSTATASRKNGQREVGNRQPTQQQRVRKSKKKETRNAEGGASFFRYCRALEALIALMLAIMVVMVFGNVVLRYGFNSGITVSEEVSRWLFVWMTFLGAIVAVREHGHLGTDMLVARAAAWRQEALPVASHTC